MQRRSKVHLDTASNPEALRMRRLLGAPECDTERESGWADSNRRPLDPQSSALTKLRYTPQMNAEPIPDAAPRPRQGGDGRRARPGRHLEHQGHASSAADCTVLSHLASVSRPAVIGPWESSHKAQSSM